MKRSEHKQKFLVAMGRHGLAGTLLAACMALWAPAAVAQGYITVTTGGNVVVAGGHVVSTAGSFINNGTYIDSAGTFDVLAGCTFSGTGTTRLLNMVVNNAGSTIFNSLVSVYNTGTVTAGAVDANNNLYIRSDNNSIANLVNNGALTHDVQGIIARATVTTGGCPSYTSALSLNISGTVMQYQWQTSADSTSWATVSGATNDTYTATVTATAYYRCSLTTTNTAYAQNTPGIKLLFTGTRPVSIAGTPAVCTGESTVLSDATSGGTWSSSNAGVASIGSATGVANGVSTGTAMITYTLPGGCYVTSVLTVNAAPTVGSTGGGIAICSGNTATLSGTGADTYSWTGGISNGVAFTPSVGVNTYTVTGTTGSCSNTAVAIVTVNATPTVGSTGGGAICSGTTATLSGTGATSYSWTGGITNGTAFTPAVGVNSYTVTGTTGSCSGTAVATVTVNSVPQVINSGGAIGNITTIAGTGVDGYTGDGGAATVATLNDPRGVIADASGNIYIAEYNNNVIRKISPSGVISTFAGTGSSGFSGDGGLATAATLYSPWAIALDGAGNMYIAEYNGQRIRKINTSGIISTFAGNGTNGFSGDGGAATAASLNNPVGIATDAAGNVYISDRDNLRIRAVNTSGIISTVAGNGTSGYSVGSAATATGIGSPLGIATDAAGNLYIGCDNVKVIKVSTSGITSTIAGSGTYGYSGDGGPATAANIGYVYGLAVNSAGTVYMADYTNNRVRQVNAAGVIATIAGNGTTPDSGDGAPATAATTQNPMGVCLDAGGNVYIAEYSGNRIRKISVSSEASPCAGVSITLSDATSGGTWSSSATGVATINASTGVAAGITAGTSTITYALSTGCYTTSVLTVNASPTVGTTGSGAICSGAMAALSGTGAATYTWTGGISNGIAFTPSVGVNTYTVTGTTGSCSNTAVATVTVNTTPIVGSTGGGTICSGTTATLSGTGAASYSWTGGITNGTAFTPSVGVNTYTVTGTDANSCTNTATATVTVNALPTVGSTGGGITICSGVSATLSGTGASTYSWTGGISNGVAFTPAAGVNSYTVTGTDANGCSNAAVATVTVTPMPDAGTITGTGAFCSGSTLVLSNVVTGGAWSSSTTSVATVNASGVVTGIAAGAATISYTKTTTCGTAVTTAPVTVNAATAAIAGSTAIEVTAYVTYMCATTGGTWSSSDPSVASVSSTGVVTGVSVGTATITYSTGSCYSLKTITVSASTLAPIAGNMLLCIGGNSVLTNFSSPGITWTCSDPGVATIGITSGVITPVAAGTAVITFTSSSGSYVTAVITVNPAPASITGSTTLCVGATSALATTDAGGTWSSHNRCFRKRYWHWCRHSYYFLYNAGCGLFQSICCHC
jgi:uncharacterized protein YjdB